jgi:hypothetical protein
MAGIGRRLALSSFYLGLARIDILEGKSMNNSKQPPNAKVSIE